jgi:hypothetical protein
MFNVKTMGQYPFLTKLYKNIDEKKHWNKWRNIVQGRRCA